jgi:glutamyl-tRNA synthetase
MTVKLRFAPSPTGNIHVGNIRTALMNWLFARNNGGHFMLRIDDTDAERSTHAYEEGIRTDLTWLGLTWDSTAKQSDRMARYHAVVEDLKAKGRMYAAYETPEELDWKRKRQLAKRLPPVYDRASLHLTAEKKAEYEAEGRKPHWRFLLEERPVIFQDMIRGEVKIDAASLSDPVLMREDGTFLYTLCSVVDDIDFNITHIIRGEDHVTNTGVQVQIFEAMGGTVPTFGHHPLLLDENGDKLSKRIGSLSVAGLREDGLEPLTILSYLARLGSSDPMKSFLNYEDLAKEFNIDHVSKAPARFVPHDLENMNAHIVAGYSFEGVKEHLATLGISGEKAEPFWMMVRGNLTRLSDAVIWWQCVTETLSNAIEISAEDKPYLETALTLLPSEPWTETTTWSAWTNALKEATGRKGKALFMPLRQVLTGQEHGPEMNKMLPLMGEALVKERLKKFP